MNLSSRQSRILWEARPDPDAARRLARPFVAIGWIVLVGSVFSFPGQLIFERDGAAPPISASLAEHSHRIEEVRIATHELRGLAIRATLLLLLSTSFFLAPTIAAAVARHRRASFGALPSPAGKHFAVVRDDLPDGTCRALLVFPEPVPTGRRPKPVLHIRGPFRPEDADRSEDILRRELGLPPRDATESTPMPAPHEFPPWMIPDERTRLAAKIAPGERLLWVGRPVERAVSFAWLAPLMGVFLAYTAYMALSKLPGSGVSTVIRESVPAWARQLFSMCAE